MSKKLLVSILMLFVLITSVAFGEDLTVEQLLVSDTWKGLDGASNTHLVFNSDGTGTETKFAFHWNTTIFGVDLKYDNYDLISSCNLLQENGIPILQIADNSTLRWARECDMGAFSQPIVAGVAAATEEPNTISAIKDLVLLDKDGIKIYFSGKFKEDNFLHMEVIIENNTSKNVEITYSGKANGWNLGSSYIISNANPVHANSKAKCYLWFKPEDIDATTCREIESLDLVFKAKNRDTREELFVAETGLVDLKNGSVSSPTTEESAPVQEYALGEQVSTDMVEFTLNAFDFVYHLDPASYVEKDDIKGGSLGPGKEMVFANPEYLVRNIAKNEISVSKDIEFVVDYNNGYQYGMNDGKVCYLVDSPYVGGKYTSTSYVNLKLSPLTKEDYEVYIPTTELIDTDTASPLKVIVKLKSTEGMKEFVYRIR